jgi:steroid 5-alpha reductase family enzyme
VNHFLLTLAIALGMMTALWPLSVWLKDVSIIDIAWGPAFAIVALACAALSNTMTARGWIVLGLVWIWALRLGVHVYRRWRVLGHEDYRYTEIRRGRGSNFPLTSLFWVFWLQAILLWVISWPLQAVFTYARPISWLDGAAIVLASSGVVIEAVADAQLTRFRADPRNHGKVLDKGIWAWSRHPNYFGDFTLWWGFFAFGIASGGPWWALLGPVVMSALLIHYSGGRLMEDTIVQRRSDYGDYARRTSFFIPWPPASTRK